jgi:hypothetical protein
MAVPEKYETGLNDCAELHENRSVSAYNINASK